MRNAISIGIPVFLTLTPLGGTARAEQPAVPGYYYYPQPAYYQPYAPYGYQAPGYAPARAAAPTQAAKSASEKGAAAASRPEIDSSRYPVVERDAVAAVDGIAVQEARLGGVLAGADGRTLYVAFRETAGAAGCDPSCSKLWRPYLALAGKDASGDFAVVEREDGTRQWTYDGRPLYQWIGDREAGEVTGDGVDGIWLAVRVRRG